MQGNTTRRIFSLSLPAILSGLKFHTLFFPTSSHRTGLIVNITCYLSYMMKVSVGGAITFLNMIDIGTLHLLHQHHLLLVLLVPMMKVSVGGVITFLNMMDTGTLHLLHQHYLLLFLLVGKTPNGSKMQSLHTVCQCNTVFLLKYPTNFVKRTNERANGRLRLCFYAGNIVHFHVTYEKVRGTGSLQPSGCNGTACEYRCYKIFENRQTSVAVSV